MLKIRRDAEQQTYYRDCWVSLGPPEGNLWRCLFYFGCLVVIGSNSSPIPKVNLQKWRQAWNERAD